MTCTQKNEEEMKAEEMRTRTCFVTDMQKDNDCGENEKQLSLTTFQVLGTW